MPPLGRYIKQLILKDFGVEAQMKLHQAKVLVIGAGGLGCSVLTSLNAIGVGNLGFIDFDLVEESNLHRQLLYHHDDIGRPKTVVAAERLAKQNPQTILAPIQDKLTASNSLSLIKDYDMVVDATDNFETRYLINDACILENKAWIYGSIFAHQGQVAIFNVLHQGIITNYRDAFPQTPKPGDIPNCAETGVLGLYPTLLGTFQANEVVKLITGYGIPLIHKLLTIDFKEMIFYQSHISPCGKDVLLTRELFLQNDYQVSCNLPNGKKV